MERGRWIRHAGTGALLLFLGICTVQAKGYEREHTIHVETAPPVWTPDRQMFLPQGAFYEKDGVWTVRTEDTIWGSRQFLVLEETVTEEQTDGSVLVYGLRYGTDTQVVVWHDGKLEPRLRAQKRGL